MKRLTVIQIAIVMLTAIICCGCSSDHNTIENINRAEQLCKSDPEKALDIMANIDRSTIHGNRDNARYALIYSEALYYNRIYVDKDTLTRSMAEYYRESDRHEERVRALYQYSLVMQYSENMAEAILTLTQAEESFAHIDNKRLEGLIHRSKGDVYGNGCLFKNALEEYKLCKECFNSESMNEHSAFADFDIGCVYMQMRDYTLAEQHLMAARDYAVENSNKILLCDALHELCKNYIHTENYDKCRETLAQFDTYDCLLFNNYLFYCNMAVCEAEAGMFRSAADLLIKADNCDDAVTEDIEYTYYVVYRFAENSEKALAWHERTKNRQDDLMLQVLEHPVLNVQVEMLQNKLNSEKRERELIRQRDIVAYSAIFIIIVFAVIYIWYRNEKKNQDIQQYIDTIKELQNADRNMTAPILESISTLYRDRFAELNNLCDIFYDHSGTSRQKNLVFEQLENIISTIKSDQRRLNDMESAVNKYRKNLMQQLRDVLPRLSERDYRVALYSFAGFSNRAISLFIDSDPATISKIKYSIKQKLRKIDSSNCEAIINALSEK